MSKVSDKYGSKNFLLVKELVDIIISSNNSFDSLSGKQKELDDLELYIEKLCQEILKSQNDNFVKCKKSSSNFILISAECIYFQCNKV